MIYKAEGFRTQIAKWVADSSSASHQRIAEVAALLFLGVVAAISLWTVGPPRAAQASAPPTEFSSERAMNHVKAIAQKPRPVGSEEHAKAMAYIIEQLTAQGFHPEVQKKMVVGNLRDRIHTVTVQNIAARLNGGNNSGAVLLAAHYDSVPTGPGAADDASGVSSLLETARALKSSPPLKNDVIFLFTDGEEIALSGVRAFTNDHPWAKDVRVALNFEARGTGGPVFMFETSEENGWLIENMSKAAPYPFASSYMYHIYKAQPYDTDLTAFRRQGIPGLNFAFLKGEDAFHSQTDSIQNLDERSIQHHGSYALALTREFGNSNLDDIEKPNSIYFDILGSTLIHYPRGLVIPITIAIGLAFATIVTIGVKKKRLAVRDALLGFAALVVGISVVIAASTFLGQYIRSIAPLLSPGTSSNLMVLGYLAFAIAIVSGTYYWFGKKASIQGLFVGGLFCWLVLAVITTFVWEGASYLVDWPLLFALLPLGYLLMPRKERFGSLGFTASLCLSAVPVIILIVPTSYIVFLGLGWTRAPILMIPPVLMIGLLIPHLYLVTSRIRKRRVFICAAALLAPVFITASILSNTQARPSSVFYGLNADAKTAIWASTDFEPDDWTSQFFPSGTTRNHLPEFFPLGSEFLSASAPVTSLSPPEVTRIEDKEADGVRTLRIRITSVRKAPVMELVTDIKSEILKASVNGEPLRVQVYSNRLRLRHTGLPEESLELALELKPSQPFVLRVVDYTYGITESAGLAFKARPKNVMPGRRDVWLQDSVAVSKVYTL